LLGNNLTTFALFDVGNSFVELDLGSIVTENATVRIHYENPSKAIGTNLVMRTSADGSNYNTDYIGIILELPLINILEFTTVTPPFRYLRIQDPVLEAERNEELRIYLIEVCPKG